MEAGDGLDGLEKTGLGIRPSGLFEEFDHDDCWLDGGDGGEESESVRRLDGVEKLDKGEDDGEELMSLGVSQHSTKIVARSQRRGEDASKFEFWGEEKRVVLT